jgi:hypothetical protein
VKSRPKNGVATVPSAEQRSKLDTPVNLELAFSARFTGKSFWHPEQILNESFDLLDSVGMIPSLRRTAARNN